MADYSSHVLMKLAEGERDPSHEKTKRKRKEKR